ncbi:hypothetical protein [Nocardia sp. NPDC049526]|uniref:hypothetical protein n=1 Tax=Nocardia sp. NPDC049526 TaxID=3364316 RepID=UPI00378F3719
MARSRRLKVSVEDNVRVVLSVLAGEMSAAGAARGEYGVGRQVEASLPRGRD